MQARKSSGKTEQWENLAASFLAVHLNFPHFLRGEIPLFGQKGSCLPCVLNHEVGRSQWTSNPPNQHAEERPTSISQENSRRSRSTSNAYPKELIP